jgi:hypothetical protein
MVPGVLLAQSGAGGEFLDGVRPFISFIEDAPMPTAGYGEAQFQYFSGDLDGFLIGAQGDYLFSPMITAGGRFGFMSVSVETITIDPETFQQTTTDESESGLADPVIFGRYTVSENAKTRIAAGGLIELPVGSEDIGHGTLDFGAFGALRYALTKGVILGHFGIRMNGDVDNGPDGELSILFGGGMLYPVDEQVTVTGEFTFETERYEHSESMVQLTPGVDYQLESGLKLRGAMALGLSDGAPDFILMAGAAMPFGG